MNDDGLLSALVAIPSVTGDEAAAVRFLREEARRDGFRVIEDAVGNFIAEAGHGPRRLLFVGHVDTVPGHIPVRVEEGFLWGRGAVDAKGALAAAYCAARPFVGSPDVTLRIVGAVGEEGDSRGARALDLAWIPDWIVNGEPSGAHGFTLAYKGILRGAFRLERERRHGAHPGPTAVEEAMGFWGHATEALRLEDRFDAIQGHLTDLSTHSDGLRDQVEGAFHLRLPPGTGPEEVETALADLARTCGVHLQVTERVPGAQGNHRSPLAAAFREAIRADGGEPRSLRKTGTADFNLLAARHSGVPIVAYGPGDAALDHTPHERLELSEYRRAVAILGHVFRRFAGSGGRAGADFLQPVASPVPR